jgi:hypothetical protein
VFFRSVRRTCSRQPWVDPCFARFAPLNLIWRRAPWLQWTLSTGESGFCNLTPCFLADGASFLLPYYLGTLKPVTVHSITHFEIGD